MNKIGLKYHLRIKKPDGTYQPMNDCNRQSMKTGECMGHFPKPRFDRPRFYTCSLHKGHIADCPACYDRNGNIKPLKNRVIEWFLSGNTGVSSETLCAYMLGFKRVKYQSPPSDASDRWRCIQLLNTVPEWWERLDELAEAEPGRPHTVNGETNHKYGWREQIPLIKKEAGRE